MWVGLKLVPVVWSSKIAIQFSGQCLWLAWLFYPYGDVWLFSDYYNFSCSECTFSGGFFFCWYVYIHCDPSIHSNLAWFYIKTFFFFLSICKAGFILVATITANPLRQRRHHQMWQKSKSSYYLHKSCYIMGKPTVSRTQRLNEDTDFDSGSQHSVQTNLTHSSPLSVIPQSSTFPKRALKITVWLPMNTIS